MKNKKSIFLVLIMIALIIVNIIYEINRDSFSNDADDNKIIKLSEKYIRETDENKNQIIFSCFNRLITFISSNNTDALNSILKDTDYDDIKSITNVSVQNIYKYENENSGIYYVEAYVEKKSKLELQYYKFDLDYIHSSYQLTKTDKEDYINAKNNKASKDLVTSIEVDEYNVFTYNDESLNIAHRYLNDCYLKAKYIPNEAKKIILSGSMNTKSGVSLNQIETFKKEINNNNITYYVNTQNTEYEIIVYSIMDYKINIITQEE